MRSRTRRENHGQPTNGDFLEAEGRLKALLHAKGFSREWIERNIAEVMAQSRSDFAVRLASGRRDETVNLLVVIAYRRAMKALEWELVRENTEPLETISDLVDESDPTPEERLVDRDRQARLIEAFSHLPERERRLLALVYFEEMSVRQAGRRLGWGKSSADRHHRAALDRLQTLLGDRNLLGLEIAVPAFLAAGQPSLARRAVLWLEGSAETAREAATLGGARVAPAAETGNAAAMSGAGRAAAGVCGAAVVACLAGAATGVVGPGVEALGDHPESKAGEKAPRNQADPTGGVDAASEPGPIEPSAASSEPQVEQEDGSAKSGSPRRSSGRRAKPKVTAAPTATPEQVVSEFGVESAGGSESASGSEAASGGEGGQRVAPSSSGSSGSSGSGSGGSQAATEFGF